MNAYAMTSFEPETSLPGGSPDHDSHARIEERLRWLARTQEDLARTIKRAPWFALSALAALPVGLLGGVFAAAAVAGFGLCLPMVLFYLSWCHQQEYAAEEATLREHLTSPDGAARTGAMRPWRVPGKLSQL